MSIDWASLRPLEGSRHKAFEELCSQFASAEPVPTGSKFIRKGAPDAGLECYWKLPSGDGWGWQAKFFLSNPGASQWAQIDESVKRAFSSHPNLTRYFICFLLDRPDPRKGGEIWFMDEWNDHEKKWIKLAKDRGLTIEFLYWGEHEMWDRLSKEIHQGRSLFWFNKELFSPNWFSKRVDEAVANVGPRYTQALNVELPIAKVLDGVGTIAESVQRLQDIFVEVRRSYKKCRTAERHAFAKDLFDSVAGTIAALLKFSNDTNIEGWGTVDWGRLIDLTSNARRSIDLLIAELKRNAETAKTIQKTEKKVSESPRIDHSYQISSLRRLVLTPP